MVVCVHVSVHPCIFVPVCVCIFVPVCVCVLGQVTLLIQGLGADASNVLLHCMNVRLYVPRSMYGFHGNVVVSVALCMVSMATCIGYTEPPCGTPLGALRVHAHSCYVRVHM